MNRRQRNVAIVVVIVLLGMLLYPPFVAIDRGGRIYNMGFHFILGPPHMGILVATVNTYLLFVQIITVLVVGAIVWHLFKDREQKIKTIKEE